MTLVHAAALRDLLADAVGAAHDDGYAQAAVLQLREGSTVVVEFEFEYPAFGAPVDGVVTLLGTPIAAVAVASATAVDNFVTRDRSGDIVLSGSITAVSFGGDIEVTNVTIANGQSCSIQSLTYEAPL